MAIKPKIDIIEAQINVMKEKLSLPTTASLQEVVDNTGTGGGYDGELPNNSSIKRVLCVGNELRVYLNVDGIASGTRVYYKENDLPTLEDSYVDVPSDATYGVISNVNINSMYGFRVAAYVVYDENKKAFNNSKSIGSTGFKLTTQYNPAGAVLLDLPAEVQGKDIKFTTYSTYTDTFYLGIDGKLYKLDCTTQSPQFEQIGSDQTFSGSMRMTPTDQGLFIQGSSYWLLYNEQDGSWLDTRGSTSYYLEVLSNEDIFLTKYSTLKKFNKQNKTWEAFNGASTYSNWYVDNGVNIYVCTYYSGSTGFKLYKYNPSTTNYDLVGEKTTTESNCNFEGVKEIVGTILVFMKRELCFLKNNEFKKINISLASSYARTYSNDLFGTQWYHCDNNLIQDPDNVNIIYFLHAYGSGPYSNTLYKINLDTEEVKKIYVVTGQSSLKFDIGIYYNRKIITNRAYYDIDNDNFVSNYIDPLYNSFIVINNNLYCVGPKLRKWNSTTNSFDVISTICSKDQLIYYIVNGNKIYLYTCTDYTDNLDVGIKVFDAVNETVTQITTGDYRYAVMVDNKLYFRGRPNKFDIKQFIVNLSDDTYYESEYKSGTGFKYSFGDIRSAAQGGASLLTGHPDSGNTYSPMVSSDIVDMLYAGTMYDSSNKIIYGLDKQLLDLSVSTKTYTLRAVEWYMYVRVFKGACYYSNDKTEIVVLFNNQEA